MNTQSSGRCFGQGRIQSAAHCRPSRSQENPPRGKEKKKKKFLNLLIHRSEKNNRLQFSSNIKKSNKKRNKLLLLLLLKSNEGQTLSIFSIGHEYLSYSLPFFDSQSRLSNSSRNKNEREQCLYETRITNGWTVDTTSSWSLQMMLTDQFSILSEWSRRKTSSLK